MRKRTAGGKSTTRWRLSFWRFSIGFRIITALFHTKSALFSECFFAYFISNFSECGASVRTAWKSGCGAPPKRKRSRGPSAEAEKDMRKLSRRGCSDAGICDKLPHLAVCALLRRKNAARLPPKFPADSP